MRGVLARAPSDVFSPVYRLPQTKSSDDSRVIFCSINVYSKLDAILGIGQIPLVA